MNRDEYCIAFDEVRADFEKSVAGFGLPFEAEESQPRVLRARAVCDHCENGGASLWSKWISPACLACRTGEKTATFFVSLKCTRHCYFCFNENQEDYAYHRVHERDIAAELRAAHAAGARFRHLAITGGEPCLHPAAALAFVNCAKEIFPGVHVRLYTSGDCLDDGLLDDLAKAGLDEMRFSVKLDDPASSREVTLARIEAAVARIPDVMVEMPVIPGTLSQMKDLLVRLDVAGVRGVNLLEFCFPLVHADAFAQRGFKLRRNPYVVPYNYWYAGGLPVAGSETEGLDLLRFAAQRNLDLGVHYCSLDNKLTGQIYQQNKPFLLDEAFSVRYPWLSFDQQDYFLKCAKAFGDDVAPALHLLEKRGIAGRWLLDDEIPQLLFPLEEALSIAHALPRAKLGVSFNVLEADGSGMRVRELTVEPFTV